METKSRRHKMDVHADVHVCVSYECYEWQLLIAYTLPHTLWHNMHLDTGWDLANAVVATLLCVADVIVLHIHCEKLASSFLKLKSTDLKAPLKKISFEQ